MTESEKSVNFFARLPEVTSFADVVLRSSHHDIPSDHFIVITDVKGSTQAIEDGRYRDVNALGVASILALRNALPTLELPFVFGGDGATIVVPGSHLSTVDAALRGVRELAKTAFSLDLRVSRVRVEDVRDSGHPVRVARYRQSENVALAAFSGKGFSVAEEWVKSPLVGERYAVPMEGPLEADFSGFECRWQPIRAKRGRFVCLLVVAVAPTAAERESTYLEVIRGLEALGCMSGRPPFDTRQMRLKGVWGDFSTEAKVLSGANSGASYEARRKRARDQSLIGKALLLMKKEAGGFDGKTYKKTFLDNTDHLKFDEALRMVIDLSEDQLRALQEFLMPLHGSGRLAYGTHESDEAMVTCIVSGYEGNHLHFLDGTRGGYALASKPLKAQLRALTGTSLIPGPVSR